MITTKDLCDIVSKKITNDAGKAIIRNSFPPNIAEPMSICC